MYCIFTQQILGSNKEYFFLDSTFDIGSKIPQSIPAKLREQIQKVLEAPGSVEIKEVNIMMSPNCPDFKADVILSYRTGSQAPKKNHKFSLGVIRPQKATQGKHEGMGAKMSSAKTKFKNKFNSRKAKKKTTGASSGGKTFFYD